MKIESLAVSFRAKLFLCLLCFSLELSARLDEVFYHNPSRGPKTIDRVSCWGKTGSASCSMETIQMKTIKGTCYLAIHKIDFSKADLLSENFETVYDSSSNRYLVFSVHRYREPKKMLKYAFSRDSYKIMDLSKNKEGIVLGTLKKSGSSLDIDCKKIKYVSLESFHTLGK